MTQCDVCGAEIGEGFVFCPTCGEPVLEEGLPEPKRPVKRPIKRPIPISEADRIIDSGETKVNKKLAKAWLTVVIFAIVALIVFSIIPWSTVVLDQNGQEYTVEYDKDMHWVGGDEVLKNTANLAVANADNETSAVKIYKDTTHLAFNGAVLGTVFSIIGLVATFIRPKTEGKKRMIMGLIAVLSASILLICAVMMLVSGSRFIGANVDEVHLRMELEDQGSTLPVTNYFPAAYGALMLGLALLPTSLNCIKGELLSLRREWAGNLLEIQHDIDLREVD